MNRWAGWLAAYCLLTGLSGLSHAQAPAAETTPSGVVLKSVDELYADLEAIMDLAGEKATWTNTLKDVLDTFVAGVDMKKPLLILLKPEGNQVQQILTVPVSNIKAFMNNIKALGVKSRRVTRDLHQTTKDSKVFEGFIREAGGYVLLGQNKADVTAKLVPPEKIAKDVLGTTYDAGVLIQNAADDAAKGDRSKSLQKAKDEVFAAMKKGKNESDDEYALRKMSVEHQFAELQRYYVESARIFGGFTLDAAGKKASSILELTALPSTDLAASLADIGKQTTAFPGFQISHDKTLSVHINLPVDALRQKNFAEEFTHGRTVVNARIEKNEKLSAERKQRLQQLASNVYDIADQVLKDGHFNSFLFIEKGKNGHSVAIGGLKLDSSIVTKQLEGLTGDDIKRKIESVGDVEISSLSLPDETGTMGHLFGKGDTLYVGTGPDTVWYALGDASALEQLKVAINTLKTPGADAAKAPAPLDVHLQLLPFLEAFDRWATENKHGKPEARKMGLDMLKAGDGEIDVKLTMDGEKVVIHTNLHSGVLRYIGKVIAKYAKETLN